MVNASSITKYTMESRKRSQFVSLSGYEFIHAAGDTVVSQFY